MSAEITISARVPADLSQQIDLLATAMRRNRSWIVEEALRSYVEEQAWQVQAIQEALADYRSGHAELVPHEEVDAAMEQLEAEITAALQP